jgi:SNF2 family DNA or RNA helicase
MEQYGLLAGLGAPEGDHLRFSSTQAMLIDALLTGQEDVEVDSGFLELRERMQNFAGVAPAVEPAGFKGELRGYQREGLGWLKFLEEFRFGGCLADDMGLGKTVQLLALIQDRKIADVQKRPSLIVVPKSLMFNWAHEIERFTPQLTHVEYTGLERHALRDDFPRRDIILTTYGTLRRDISLLQEIEFDYAVLDEAQTIKNAASQVAKACRLLKARHRLALSGTPIENHLGDLWSIFEFLNPGMLGRSSAFRLSAGNNPDSDARRVLARGLRPFVLRRTKGQVATELPERMEETIYCRMGSRQRKLYSELRDHYRQSLLGIVREQGMNKSRMHVLEALLRLRQAACHPALLDEGSGDEPFAKLEYLCPQLEELIDEGHKSLVFSQFTSMLAIVRRHLDARGIRYAYLDGKTRARKQVVEQFQGDPDCMVFLISLKAGGLGLNLTAAEYVFLLDPWWNPAVEAQAIDRAHRVGQTRQVFAYRLICQDTVEEKILELQSKKRELADAILEADNRLISELTTEDLEMLLS